MNGKSTRADEHNSKARTHNPPSPSTEGRVETHRGNKRRRGILRSEKSKKALAQIKSIGVRAHNH